MVKYDGAFQHQKGSRHVNEDIFACPKIQEDEQKYFILTDGVGSSELSKEAAKTATNTIANRIKAEIKNLTSDDQIIKLIDESIQQANTKVLAYNKKVKEEGGRGRGQTTIDVCVIYNDSLYIGHVGDGRVYVMHETGDLELITKDENAAWLEPEKGQSTPPEITKVHPLSKNLLNAIGESDDLKIKRYVYPLDRISTILVATDGLYRCLTDEEIRAIFIENKNLSAKEVLKKLFAKAENPEGIVPIFMKQNKVVDELARIQLGQDNRTAILYTIWRD